MADFLVQALLSNMLFGAVLACIAWLVQRYARLPSLANLLWALVLIKLVTPPLIAVPLVTVPSIAADAPSDPAGDMPDPADRGSDAGEQKSSVLADATTAAAATGSQRSGEPAVLMSAGTSAPQGTRLLALGGRLWLLVSCLILTVSSLRIVRFHRLLTRNCRIDPRLTGTLATGAAQRLGLRCVPDVFVTTAQVAPFVWWLRGRTVVVLPHRAVCSLDDDDLRWIITHELAHVRRRDHWFRWLEWVALIALWWNPLTWWARTQLRISEEMACDDLVLQSTEHRIHEYANSLLNMAELLVPPAIHPPVVASAINSGGTLEERLKMMINNQRNVPAAVRRAIVAAALCVFPIGLVYAQDFKAVERRLGEAVAEGELSLEQASRMMEVLRQSAHERDMQNREREYHHVERQIHAAVEAGKLSKEDAKKKLSAVRRELFEHPEHNGDHAAADHQRREMEEREQKYEHIQREIHDAVEAGKMSEEDAERKLIALRRELFERPKHDEEHGEADHERREMEERKQKFEHIRREIQRAVEADKLSEEEAERKLIAVRRELFERPEKARARRDLEERERQLHQAERKIHAAVEAGKMSEEEAEKTLKGLKRKLRDK